MLRLLFLLIAAQSLCAAAITRAGEGSAILANPVISATVTVECERPEGRRVLTSVGTGTQKAFRPVSQAYHGEPYKRTPEGEMACRFGYLRSDARELIAGDSHRFNGVRRRTLQPDPESHFASNDLLRPGV